MNSPKTPKSGRLVLSDLSKLQARLTGHRPKIIEWLFNRPERSVSSQDVADFLYRGGADPKNADPKKAAGKARTAMLRLQEELEALRTKSEMNDLTTLFSLDTPRRGAGPSNSYTLVLKDNMNPTANNPPPDPNAHPDWLFPDGRAFRWRTKREDWMEVPLWLLAKSKSSLELTLVEGRKWQPPKGFLDYESFRDQRWEEQRSKDPKVFNGATWVLSKYTTFTVKRLSIELERCEYKDYHATTLSLTKPTGRAGETVFGLLRRNYLETGKIPSAPLAVNVAVITKDLKMVISHQSPTHTVDPGDWIASVSGTMNADLDVDPADYVLPSPRITARKQTLEEIGVLVQPRELSWVTFAMGLRLGHPALLAEANVPFSAEEVHEAWAERQDKREADDIDFVPLTAKAVRETLARKDRPHRTYFKLAFALALWRRGLAELET